ncbi:MAG: SRPBCC family protein [Armatimonadota bacterium]|nr:SRPBCC family protein [Armatimonadota bacterium]MDR7548402.1 SRPBCC family protein [Armatimonadota bacterium]
MRLQSFRTVQRLSVAISDAWACFSDPRNLRRLTPPWMRLEVLSPLPDCAYAGLLITYRVRPVAGIPVTWVTEISHVCEPYLFVDEQRLGPYRFWHHQHLFREVPGGVEMEDIVHYALPLGWLGLIVNRLVVAPRLQEIFEFRRRALEEHFAARAEGHAPTRRL